MFRFEFVDMAAITQQYSLNIGAMRRHFSSREMFPVSQTEGEEGLMFQGHVKYDKVNRFKHVKTLHSSLSSRSGPILRVAILPPGAAI